MKKYILGIGAITAIAVPMVAAVSCGGSSETQANTKFETRFQDVKITWEIEGDEVKSVVFETNKELTPDQIEDYLWTSVQGYIQSTPDGTIGDAFVDYANNFDANIKNVALLSNNNLQHMDITERIIHAPGNENQEISGEQLEQNTNNQAQPEEPTQSGTQSQPEAQTQTEIQATALDSSTVTDLSHRFDDLDRTNQFRDNWHTNAQSVPMTSLEDTAFEVVEQTPLEDTAIDLTQQYRDLDQTRQYRQDWHNQALSTRYDDMALQREVRNDWHEREQEILDSQVDPVQELVDDVSTVLSKEVRTDWNSMEGGIKNQLITNNSGAMPNITATVYKTKYINFAFDNDLKMPEADAVSLIHSFFEKTNWGLGLTTMDTILITNKQMGSAGWGSAAKDMLVACVPMDGTERDKYNQQVMFDTLRHEYGHHETLTSTSLVGGEMQRMTNLIDNQMPNYEVFDTVNNHKENIEQLRTDMMHNVNPAGTPVDVASIYSAPMFDAMDDLLEDGSRLGYSVDKDFAFNIAYHYDKGAEALNRPMTVLEESALVDEKYLPGSSVMLADNLGFYFSDASHSQKLLDPTTGLYDQENTNKLIELWRDYVYGYEKNTISVDYFNVAGYSNFDVDFAVVQKATALGLQETIVPLTKAPTHFLSGRTSFDTDATWDTDSFAYGGVIQPRGSFFPYSSRDTSDPNNQPKFFKDTNQNGELDEDDTQVEDVVFNWNTGFDFM